MEIENGELDKYVQMANELPVVNSIITELGYSRAGLQIKKQGNVIAELTSIHETGRINVLKGFQKIKIGSVIFKKLKSI